MIGCYYKVGQVTKYYRLQRLYCNVRQELQSVTVIAKWDVAPGSVISLTTDTQFADLLFYRKHLL